MQGEKKLTELNFFRHGQTKPKNHWYPKPLPLSSNNNNKKTLVTNYTEHVTHMLTQLHTSQYATISQLEIHGGLVCN